MRRVELARKRQSVDLAVYGERRDNNISFGAVQTPCVCEPVGMEHCVPTESTAVRKIVVWKTGKEIIREKKMADPSPILYRLFDMQDTKYRDFQSKLIPNVSDELFIGIRTPNL